MSLLSKMLARLSPSARPRPSDPATTTDRYIKETINQALTKAGLIKSGGEHAAKRQSLLSQHTKRAVSATAPSQAAPKFTDAKINTEAGSLIYKLFVPTELASEPHRPLGLILMLHGCTQSPDDFAIGTRMNEWGQRHRCLVAYPAQSSNANGSKCWNWFRPGDQARGKGEPALLAALTRDLVARYGVDSTRVYVAGLSAGAAMAVILGRTYPDLFAAVGAHSGLPYRAAKDVPSAFSAMSSGSNVSGGGPAPSGKASDREGVVPLIIFHGDADRTVAPSNGKALLQQTMGPASGMLPESEFTDQAKGYTRLTYTTAMGAPFVEYWSLQGVGHAWSGGDGRGTYADAKGPDASAEMIRFFLEATEASQSTEISRRYPRKGCQFS